MVTPELLEYISAQLTSGISKEEISKVLIAQGWGNDDIEEAYLKITSGQNVSNVSVKPDKVPGEVKRKGHLGIFLFIFLLLIIGAGAYWGYFYYYLAPDKVLGRTVTKTQTISSFDYTAEIALKTKSNSFNNSSQANSTGLSSGFFPSSFLVHSDGTFDLTDPVNLKHKMAINLQSGIMSIAKVEVRFLEDIFYFKLDEENIGLTQLSELKGQWFSLRLTPLENEYLGSQNKIELSKDNLNTLYVFIKDNPVLTLSEKLKDEKIGDVDTFHYKYNINKDNVVKVINKSFELSGTAKQPIKVEDIFKDVNFTGSEIWIGKYDYYVRKVVLTATIGEKDTNSEVDSILQITFNNINKADKITAPENAKSYDQYLEEYLKQSPVLGTGTNNMVEETNLNRVLETMVKVN